MAVPPRLEPQFPLPPQPYVPAPGRVRPLLPIAQVLAADNAEDQGFSPTLFAYGVDLFHAGYFWEAHECWEELWRREPKTSLRRAALQGLILLAAARVKARQESPRGAAALYRRALAALRRAAAGGPVLPGLHIPRLIEEALAGGPTGQLVLTGPDR